MEEIVKTTRYCLFKKVSEEDFDSMYNYYWVRTTTDELNGYSWNMGYKNRLGLVSFVGGELTDSKVLKLETEFQAERQ